MERSDQCQRGDWPQPGDPGTALQIRLPTQSTCLGLKLAVNLSHQLLAVADERSGGIIQGADISQALPQPHVRLDQRRTTLQQPPKPCLARVSRLPSLQMPLFLL